jgi:hypothetical protein
MYVTTVQQHYIFNLSLESIIVSDSQLCQSSAAQYLSIPPKSLILNHGILEQHVIKHTFLDSSTNPQLKYDCTVLIY